jgi:putative phosphoesterase
MVNRKKGNKLVGILSDTHDNLPLIDEAVTQLNQYGVGTVLHAGDYISPFTITHFEPLKAKIIGVYGNNCAERSLLKKRFKDIDGDLRGFFAEVSLEGVKIALLHGHDEELLNSSVNSCAYDVVVHGHTHQVKIQQVGNTLVINPGEVCGYLTGKATMAVLDLQTRKVAVASIPQGRNNPWPVS